MRSRKPSSPAAATGRPLSRWPPVPARPPRRLGCPHRARRRRRQPWRRHLAVQPPSRYHSGRPRTTGAIDPRQWPVGHQVGSEGEPRCRQNGRGDVQLQQPRSGDVLGRAALAGLRPDRVLQVDRPDPGPACADLLHPALDSQRIDLSVSHPGAITITVALTQPDHSTLGCTTIQMPLPGQAAAPTEPADPGADPARDHPVQPALEHTARHHLRG